MQSTVKIKTKSERATIECVFPGGRGPVQCKRYLGKFNTVPLQIRAALGLWYSEVQGNSAVPEGEGTTPIAAIDDSIGRAKDLIRQLENGIRTLEAAKQKATA